jgi:hypothetical protein
MFKKSKGRQFRKKETNEDETIPEILPEAQPISVEEDDDVKISIISKKKNKKVPNKKDETVNSSAIKKETTLLSFQEVLCLFCKELLFLISLF